MTRQAISQVIMKNAFLKSIYQRIRYGKMYCTLAESGSLVAPPYEIKRLTILLYAQLFQLSTLIETGTYQGETVNALKDKFTQIFSIELDTQLYEQAKVRFANDDHIQIINGDSAKILPELLQKLEVPCLFWLDGHFCGGISAHGNKGTPITEELNLILSHRVKDHVILIDDARLFNGTADYPTLDQVSQLIQRNRPHYNLTVLHDIIQIEPPLKN